MEDVDMLRRKEKWGGGFRGQCDHLTGGVTSRRGVVSAFYDITKVWLGKLCVEFWAPTLKHHIASHRQQQNKEQLLLSDIEKLWGTAPGVVFAQLLISDQISQDTGQDQEHQHYICMHWSYIWVGHPVHSQSAVSGAGLGLQADSAYITCFFLTIGYLSTSAR